MSDMGRKPDTNEEFLRLLSKLHEEGSIVLEDVVGDDLLAALLCEVERLRGDALAVSAPFSRGLQGSTSTHIQNLFAKSAVFRRATHLEPLPILLDAFLGQGHLLFASAFNEVGPGQAAQRPHTDDMLIQLPRPFPSPVIANTVWALSEFTAENGATQVWPRSHLVSEPDATPPPTTIEMRQGSILLYHGSLLHRAGANTTKGSLRPGLIFTYCSQYIRPYENQLWLMGREQVDALDAADRSLAGVNWEWSPRDALWEESLRRLQKYIKKNGHGCPPQSYIDDDGYQLGAWVGEQRQKNSKGLLSSGRHERLSKLCGWEWEPPHGGAARPG